ncbi:MAG: sodium:proton antiporter [Firmicutes bacterium]|nr:sodium:proton antiporter [Bacillota bacterium]
MILGIAFFVFIASMIATIVLDISMVWALVVGLVAFLFVGTTRGFSVKEQMEMGFESLKESKGVVQIMLIIGLITATWRVSGTITVFVYYGIKIITPSIFLLVAYLLACLLSYALGTSYGVAGTVGVIFMALARSGGVDPVIAAGVILSGVYFGDRCAPTSSCANLVAGVTGTDIFTNVKMMMRTAGLPFAVTLAAYGFLSVQNPISHVDETLVAAFEEQFSLSYLAFIPAVFMLLLPFLKVRVKHAMLVSIVSGILVAWLVQGVGLVDVLHTCIFGYHAEGEGLGAILNGGGLVSMVEVSIILAISSLYSGIFSNTNMLGELQDMLGRACTKLGKFSVMTMMSIAMVAIFCNQTIAILMCNDLMKRPYYDCGASKEELAMDMANSVVLISGLIPWCIACNVPLTFMGADPSSVPYALYLYIVPLCYWITKKHWYPTR